MGKKNIPIPENLVVELRETIMLRHSGRLVEAVRASMQDNLGLLIQEGIVNKSVQEMKINIAVSIDYGIITESIVQNAIGKGRTEHEGSKKLIKALFIASYADEWLDGYNQYYKLDGTLKTTEEQTKKDPLRAVFINSPPIKVKTVLVSMYDKTGIEPLLNYFSENDISIVATPNTLKYLKAYGFDPISTFDFVKCQPTFLSRGSLHPYILSALAADITNPQHVEELSSLDIQKLDMIITNTKDPILNEEADPGRVLQQLTEVQIGGPSLLRWAIIHWRTCSSIVEQADYPSVLRDLKENNNTLSLSLRIRLLMRTLMYLSYKDSQTATLLKAFWPSFE